MIYHLAAGAVLVLHLLFICLVMLGGLAVLRWPRFALIHIPAAIWGVLVEAMGWYCPLTDLENALLSLAGEAGYTGGFVQRYMLAVIYPEDLTRETQIWLAGVVVVVNAAIYGWVLRRRRKRKETV
jgi:membrane protein DedA with SNARE-associated domain